MYKLLKGLSLPRNLLKQAISQGEEDKSSKGKVLTSVLSM